MDMWVFCLCKWERGLYICGRVVGLYVWIWGGLYISMYRIFMFMWISGISLYMWLCFFI